MIYKKFNNRERSAIILSTTIEGENSMSDLSGKAVHRFRIIIPGKGATEDTCEALSGALALALMQARYPNCQVYYLGRG